MSKLYVLIITYNEEKNIEFLLKNICEISNNIFILDSFSTDKTVNICKNYTKNIYYNKFENYFLQRNKLLEIVNEHIDNHNDNWYLFLDADEYLLENLKEEIVSKIQLTKCDAFYIKRRFIWSNTWIKRGYYPTKLLRLIRSNYVELNQRIVNEHYISKSQNICTLENDFVDHNRKTFLDWIKKHNNYAKLESKTYFSKQVYKNKFHYLWDKLPLLLRPFFLLIYRVFLKLGILDGPKAIFYHFSHSFAYRMLIDFYIIKILFYRFLNK